MGLFYITPDSVTTTIQRTLFFTSRTTLRSVASYRKLHGTSGRSLDFYGVVWGSHANLIRVQSEAFLCHHQVLWNVNLVSIATWSLERRYAIYLFVIRSVTQSSRKSSLTQDTDIKHTHTLTMTQMVSQALVQTWRPTLFRHPTLLAHILPNVIYRMQPIHSNLNNVKKKKKKLINTYGLL